MHINCKAGSNMSWASTRYNLHSKSASLEMLPVWTPKTPDRLVRDGVWRHQYSTELPVLYHSMEEKQGLSALLEMPWSSCSS